jgi:hypothetical protein
VTIVSEHRPLPLIDDETRPYWEGALRHTLVILRCGGCGFYVHYPKRACPRCGSEHLAATPVSGRGVVHSYTVSHHKAAPGFEDRVPFVVALIELEEQAGLRLIANLPDCPLADVSIGMAVEVCFEDVAPDVSLPQFRRRSP